ncbi:MAG: maleate cis-trans isomerase [Actinomycetes bacterium]
MPGAAPVVGLLYPGFGAEDDFPALERRLGGAVRLPLVHTSVGEDAHRVDALLDLGSAERLAEGAKALADHWPDSVMWACTSGSFVFGWEGAQKQVAGIASVLDLPVSSTSIAFVEAAKALGVRRVSVAASYPQDVARHFADFLTRGGVDVVALGSHGVITAAEVGTFDRLRVREMVRAAYRDDADAVLVPDTAMHSLQWVDELEDAVQKPVLTANQVTVWEGLRIADAATRLDGLGSLFRL